MPWMVKHTAVGWKGSIRKAQGETVLETSSRLWRVCVALETPISGQGQTRHQIEESGEIPMVNEQWRNQREDLQEHTRERQVQPRSVLSFQGQPMRTDSCERTNGNQAALHDKGRGGALAHCPDSETIPNHKEYI